MPKDLQDAYGLYENEADELYSMKTSGLCPDFEIEEQTRKAMRLHEEYYKKLTDKLCIGQEQGRLKEIGTYDNVAFGDVGTASEAGDARAQCDALNAEKCDHRARRRGRRRRTPGLPPPW